MEVVVKDIRTRFEDRVDRSGEHHLWTGARAPGRGTGRLKVDGRSVAAHRVAWELEHGSVPGGARIQPCPADPACVRVDHLRRDGGIAQPSGRRSRKGTGSMRQIRPGTWQLSVTAKGSDGSGRRVHTTVRADGDGEAARALAAFLDEVRSAAPVPDRQTYAMIVDEAIEVFLTEQLLTEKGREERTVSDYRRLHVKWFAPDIGRRLVRDVDQATLDAVFGRMRAAGLSRSRMEPCPESLRAVLPMGETTGDDAPQPDGRLRAPDE